MAIGALQTGYTTSVSYTHLDVYKRQALSGGERGIRTTLTFNNLIKQFDDYDYVFFDMGPSLGLSLIHI